MEPTLFKNRDLSNAIFNNCQLRDVEINDCDIEGMRINGISVMELLLAHRSAKPGIVSVHVEDKPAFQALGMQIKFTPSSAQKPSENAISKLWDSFAPLMRSIPHRANHANYGLMFFETDYQPGTPFDYLACVEVTQIDSIPENMIIRDVAASSYAVVTYRGPIDGIKDIYQHYQQEWLPQSEYQPVQRPEFEYYDHQFLGTLNPDSIMKLYFPVKKKD